MKAIPLRQGFCLVLLCFGGLAPDRSSALAATDATARFHQLYSREWQWRQVQFAGGDDEDSQGPAADHLPRVDAASQAARERYWTDVLKELDTISEDQLDGEDPVNYEVYRQQIGVLLANERFRTWQMPFNSDSAFWSDLGFTARGHFTTEASYRDYLGKLRDMPRYFDEQIANMRLGLARGFSQPKIVLKGRDRAIADVVAQTGERNLFYTPFANMSPTLPAAKQASLRAEALATIAHDVIPAYAKLLSFMRDEYMKQARDTLAADDLPDGNAFYRAQISEYTTLDMDPDAIHALGLKEMAGIHQQMLDTIAQTGFKGSFAEFLQFLRSDPRFYAKTPDELLKDAAWIAKRVDGKVGDYIGRLPRRRFAIEPVPADLAPVYTGGRGGPGIYLVNTYDLPSRPLYSLPALTLHESSPGHALQMPLAAEIDGLPDFRRYSYISAYGEGWALYSEYLGVEMGMYDTPYERFGYLSYQAWRAARLVVDTGLHHLHWTREQAQTYLRENTALAEHEIETEVDRYIAWPGQALSYYLGELAIRDGRARAERALGEKFDIRAFHDTVLSTGSVPLPVLNRRIDRFIANGGATPYPPRQAAP
ncbi:uncharacterized protein (DUF885 family) [Luteibacter rhizovicinus]|uniref:Uncharacterized protein (DUF885 family) n=1 Tax=Luteibacter rhizovicinus TaxID=242606 RepID=A0A4R3YWW3_9GAMM|nr:DUF885 family protein [Luteibacter rhizovicinus]TCV97655.1 uncharacterized protein (DUF885 family) [Luteibacter rhizovicinus]